MISYKAVYRFNMTLCTQHIAYIWILFTMIKLAPGAPTLSVSPSTVVVGGSVTFNCTFTQAPLISADIRSTNGRFVCTLTAAGDGTCTVSTGSGCTGNTPSCSIDKKRYSLILNSVPESRNGQQFVCRDTLQKNDDSQNVQIKILVPPTSVRINPQGKVITIVEGATTSLTCLTDATRPQSNITWYRNTTSITGSVQTVTDIGDKFITSSVLTVFGDRKIQGVTIRCTALNVHGMNPVSSSTVFVNIQYPPQGKPRVINPSLTYNISNIVTLTCVITMNGNPLATWIWTCGSRTFTSADITVSGVKSTLTFVATKHYNNVQCRCRAKSSIGPYDMSSDPVRLNVQYAAEITKFLSPSISIMENDRVVLNCTVDGNPFPTLQWQLADNGTNIKTDTSSLPVRTLEFPHITCLDTATYRAVVMNGFGYQVSEDLNISVLCKPKFDDRKKFKEKHSVGGDKNLSISLPIIGNPKPDVTWYQFGNSSNTTIQNSQSVFVLTKKESNVEYISEMKRSSMGPDDFGLYFAVLNNSVGKSVVYFTVVSEGPPDPPTDLVIDCSKPVTATLYWMSNFNGLGDSGEQEFYVLYREKNESVFQIFAEAIPDGGNNLTTHLDLRPAVWQFRVQSRNKVGAVTSLEERECKVKGLVVENSSISTIPVILGSLAAVVVIAAVALGLVLLHRIQKKKKDGIKKSIRYVATEHNVPSTSNGPQNIKNTETKTKAVKASDVYADVRKSSKKDFCENDESGFKAEVLYANNPEKAERGARNQDGLLYVEVDLRQVQEERRNVIIGEEERTDYASVDFIPPSPAK